MHWRLIHRNGEEFVGAFSLLLREDLTRILKRDGWTRGMNWADYLHKSQPFAAYKLQISGDESIQGIIAVAVRDGYVELGLVEKAPVNRKPVQQFINVGEILFAQSCLISMLNGGEGHVLLKAKTGLIDNYCNHYGMEILNRRQRRLALSPVEAQRLIGLYYLQED